MSDERRPPSRPGAGSPRTSHRAIPGELAAPLVGDWLHIAVDGAVEVYTGKAEVGQNILTSLAQAVAEELRLPVEAIGMVLADTDRTPYDAGTFGSRTTPLMAAHLHRVAATAREFLVGLAGARWGVDPREIVVADGRVTHVPRGRSAGFGELTGGRKLLIEIDDNAPVTPPDRWTVAGASVARLGGRAAVTGARQYTPDLAAPGMRFGAVLRPPAHGAELIGADTNDAAALPEVTVVHDGAFVGVVAPSRRRAAEAIATIRAEWSAPRRLAARDLFAYLREHRIGPEDEQRFGSFQQHEQGNLDAGRAAATHTIERAYTVAYIAHAPLEPRAALAEWRDGRLTVWTGTQRPFGVRAELAQALGLPEDAIRVVVPPTGGAYGGKHTGEAAIEAARLARGAGCAVKLIWSREEEFAWAYLRPAGVIEAVGGVTSEGQLVAWEYHNYNSGAAGIRTPYDVPHQRIVYHPTEAPLRQGSYRALAATANHFARESLMDELAHMLGEDPLQFRLRHLGDERLRAVFEAAAEQFGWGRDAAPPGHGFGIAGGTEKGSYVATCAEVAADRASGQVRVVRAVQAFECGAIVNPDGLRNQVEGAIIQGLGGALFEAIDFEDGAVRSNKFSRYRVPRFADVPAIAVVLLDRKDLPSEGAGETPIVGIAPAVANAIFAATGVRLRALPLVPHGLPRDETAG